MSAPFVTHPPFVSLPSSKMALRIEMYAEYEAYFAETDAMIAAYLPVSIEWVADFRLRNFAYYKHLAEKAQSAPPRPQRDRAAREYLAGYVRPSERHACLMERACPTRLIWSTVWLACIWFFGPALFPRQVETLIDFLKGLFQ